MSDVSPSCTGEEAFRVSPAQRRGSGELMLSCCVFFICLQLTAVFSL
jgi:hypothetical protein